MKAPNLKIKEGNLNIIYEDKDILVVNKPHNLSSIPSRAHQNDNLGRIVEEYISDKSFVLRIINRLDKDTAGLVTIAKNLDGYKTITVLSKEYFALCEGVFEQEKFTISAPILTQTDENGHNVMKRIISTNGKKATTHVEVIKTFNTTQNKAELLKNIDLKDTNLLKSCLKSYPYSLIKLNLETGRTHQIRVHLSSINHPLIGDTLYNSHANVGEHAFLILKKITFINSQNQTISLEIDFPNDWNQFLI